MTFFARGKNQWAVKVPTLPGKYFRGYSDRQQEEQNNRFVQYLYEKKLQVLVKSIVSLECNGILSWDLCRSIRHELRHSSRYSFGLNIPMPLSKKAVQAEKRQQ